MKGHIDELESESYSKNLRTVLSSRKKIFERKRDKIKFPPPVLTLNGTGVLFPNSINMIQGQTGAHKSRLAQIFCSAMLKLPGCTNDFLGLKRVGFENEYKVIYVDTERNLIHQFPYALQQIQMQAGYRLDDDPPKFDFLSLIEVQRAERFHALTEYIDLIVKKETENGQDAEKKLIVLDVSTDCLSDFNQIDGSMELIDWMNRIINQHNVIFLCVIHENPGSEKARGHFGSELMNKSTAQIQVALDKSTADMDIRIFSLKFLKTRSTANPKKMMIKYDDNTSTLVKAESHEISLLLESKKQKAPLPEVNQELIRHAGTCAVWHKKELDQLIASDLSVSEKTAGDRITELLEPGLYEIITGKKSGLRIELFTKDRKKFYRLTLSEEQLEDLDF